MKQQLKNVLEKLTALSNSVGTFAGASEGAQLALGCQLFDTVFNFGLLADEVQLKLQNFTPSSEEGKLVKSITELITKNQSWLQDFLSVYYVSAVRFDDTSAVTEVCKTRSGVEYLLTYFRSLNENFDEVLENLDYFGEVKAGFDTRLRSWIDDGFRGRVDKQRIAAGIPTSHWWWN